MRSDELVAVTTAPSELAAGAVIAVLDDAGIDAVMRTGDFIGGAIGIFASFTFAPTTVMVRASDLDQALRVLEENRSDSIDIDWSEVDTGDSSAPEGDALQRASARGRVRAQHAVIFTAALAALAALAVLAGALLGIL